MSMWRCAITSSINTTSPWRFWLSTCRCASSMALSSMRALVVLSCTGCVSCQIHFLYFAPLGPSGQCHRCQPQGMQSLQALQRPCRGGRAQGSERPAFVRFDPAYLLLLRPRPSRCRYFPTRAITSRPTTLFGTTWSSSRWAIQHCRLVGSAVGSAVRDLGHVPAAG